MSTNLFYSLPAKKEQISCSPYVRDLVYKRFGGILETCHITELEAMLDATGNKEYETLIELILKYDKVILHVE